MVTSKEYVFDFTDLKLLSITCKNCGTETIIDLSKPETKLPKRCTPCRIEFDPQFERAIIDFSSTYSVLSDKNSKGTMSARIRIHCELKDS
ncbi:MAG: hypothetical protein ACLPSL_01925 [Smithella sp.]